MMDIGKPRIPRKPKGCEIVSTDRVPIWWTAQMDFNLAYEQAQVLTESENANWFWNELFGFYSVQFHLLKSKLLMWVVGSTLKKANFGPGHLFLLDSMYKQNINLQQGLKLNWSNKLKNLITFMLIIYLIELIFLTLLIQRKKGTWFNPSYELWWK